MTAVLFIILGVAIFGALFWLLFGPQWRKPQAAIQSLDAEQFQLLHCRHFPQIRQLLRQEDRTFVEERASASIARAWRRERRRILLEYLDGLTEDFYKLEYLARLIASLSPDASRQREGEWFWLGLQFRMMLQLLTLRILLGKFSLPRLTQLTDFVASHAAELEVRMSQVADVLPSGLQTSTGS